MARKRDISPELWTDGKVLSLPWPAVGVYVGLISQADDAGRLEWDERELAARICGAREDATLGDVRGWMGAIVDVGLVRVYEVAGRCYALHPQWGRHQHVNRPRPSLLPNPDGVIDHAFISEGSVNGHGGAPPRARAASASASASASGSASPPQPPRGERAHREPTRAQRRRAEPPAPRGPRADGEEPCTCYVGGLRGCKAKHDAGWIRRQTERDEAAGRVTGAGEQRVGDVIGSVVEGSRP